MKTKTDKFWSVEFATLAGEIELGIKDTLDGLLRAVEDNQNKRKQLDEQLEAIEAEYLISKRKRLHRLGEYSIVKVSA